MPENAENVVETGNTTKPETNKPKPEVTETQTESRKFVPLDSIADSLAGSMPEVQDHAIEQERQQQADIADAYADLKDSDGNSFDPAIHKTNAQGEPTVTKLGKLVKKPGRKPKTGESKSHVGGQAVDSRPSESDVLKVQARASGVMAANLLLQIGIAAGGEEWHPRRDEKTGLDEKAMLENSFADYFEATGKTDIPPGMALTVAVGAYALPRFTMPKTQTRMGKLKTSIKQWWVDRKLKKHGLKSTPINEKAKPEDKPATRPYSMEA